MGKHLSIEEKLNAGNEYEENLKKIKQIKDGVSKVQEEAKKQILRLKARNRKLKIFLDHSKKSKYGGIYAINGVCYKLFGKKRSELTNEEETEYNKIMKERCRNNKKKRPRIRYDKEFKTQVLNYYKEGHSMKETAEAFMISSASVFNFVWEERNKEFLDDQEYTKSKNLDIGGQDEEKN